MRAHSVDAPTQTKSPPAGDADDVEEEEEEEGGE